MGSCHRGGTFKGNGRKEVYGTRAVKLCVTPSRSIIRCHTLAHDGFAVGYSLSKQKAPVFTETFCRPGIPNPVLKTRPGFIPFAR